MIVKILKSILILSISISSVIAIADNNSYQANANLLSEQDSKQINFTLGETSTSGSKYGNSYDSATYANEQPKKDLPSS